MTIEKRRKLLHIAIIAFAIVLCVLIVLIFVNNNKDQQQPTIDIPIETTPVVVIDQQYVRRSNASWQDGAIFGATNTSQIKEINFVKSYDATSDAYVWAFDGFRCALEPDGKMYFITGADKVKIQSMSISNAFAGLDNLEQINGLAMIDVSDVKNVYHLFYNNKSLKHIDISKWDLSNVVSVDGMFEGCNSLTSLNLSTIELPKVIAFTNVFKGCYKLTDLYMPTLTNVYHYNNAFESVGAQHLEGTVIHGDIPFDHCYSAIGMFKESNLYDYACVESFNTKNLHFADSMFETSFVEELNLSNWTTVQLESASKFCKGSPLEKISLQNWDVKSLDDMSEMFCNCDFLETVYLPIKNATHIKSTYRMFYGCSVLTELDLSAFNEAKIGNAKEMFGNARTLETIFCDGFSIEISDQMFDRCYSLHGATTFDAALIDGNMATTNGYFSKKG